VLSRRRCSTPRRQSCTGGRTGSALYKTIICNVGTHMQPKSTYDYIGFPKVMVSVRFTTLLYTEKGLLVEMCFCGIPLGVRRTATRVCHRRHVWCTSLFLCSVIMIIIICCWARTAGHVHRICVQCFDERHTLYYYYYYYTMIYAGDDEKSRPGSLRSLIFEMFTETRNANAHCRLAEDMTAYGYCFRITRRKHVTVYT